MVQRWFKENRIELATGWCRSDGGDTGERQGWRQLTLAYIYKLINQVIPYIHSIITFCNRCGTKIGQGAPRALARRSRALLAYGRCQGAPRALARRSRALLATGAVKALLGR